MNLKALLFDVDGTLADTEAHGHLPAYNHAFRDLELDWSWSPALYRDLLEQPGGRERIEHYLDHYAPDLGVHEASARADRAGWIKSVHERKSRHFRERLENGEIPLREGVDRLMTEAHEAGLQLAIVTNASRASLEPFLTFALGRRLCGYVDTIVSGEQVSTKKPAPDIYSRVCAQIHRDPTQCIAIEDSAMGLHAAHSAGVPAVVTVNADTDARRLGDAQLVVDSLGEPDSPVRVIKSPGFDVRYVNVDVLRRLQAGCTPQQVANG